MLEGTQSFAEGRFVMHFQLLILFTKYIDRAVPEFHLIAFILRSYFGCTRQCRLLSLSKIFLVLYLCRCLIKKWMAEIIIS